MNAEQTGVDHATANLGHVVAGSRPPWHCTTCGAGWRYSVGGQAEPSDAAWADATEKLREWFVGIGIESFDNPKALARDTTHRVRGWLAAAAEQAQQDGEPR